MRTNIFTREELIDLAFDFIKLNGKENFSARTFSKSLNISTSPLFKQFKNISELLDLVKKKAYDYYVSNYFNVALKAKIPSLEIGVNYIRFASENPNLFKLVFKEENTSLEFHNFLPFYDNTTHEILEIFMKIYNISEDKARTLYNHLAIYTYGLATIFADKLTDFSIEYARTLLSDLFKSLIKEARG